MGCCQITPSNRFWVYACGVTWHNNCQVVFMEAVSLHGSPIQRQQALTAQLCRWDLEFIPWALRAQLSQIPACSFTCSSATYLRPVAGAFQSQANLWTKCLHCWLTNRCHYRASGHSALRLSSVWACLWNLQYHWHDSLVWDNLKDDCWGALHPKLPCQLGFCNPMGHAPARCCLHPASQVPQWQLSPTISLCHSIL